jgi:hypothetical protein
LYLQIQWQEVANFTKDLDEIYFQDFMDMFRTFKNQVEKKRSNEVSKKQKIEKQTDYPNKK